MSLLIGMKTGEVTNISFFSYNNVLIFIIFKLILFSRPRGHCECKPEAYSRSDMAPDSAIPDWEDQVPHKEADAGLAAGRYSRVCSHKLYHGLEQWNCPTVC